MDEKQREIFLCTAKNFIVYIKICSCNSEEVDKAVYDWFILQRSQHTHGWRADKRKLNSSKGGEMHSFLLRFENLFSRERLFASKQTSITAFFSKVG